MAVHEKYRKSFTGIDGKRHYIEASSKDELEKAIYEKKRELEENRIKPNVERTFSEYYENYAKSRRLTVKESTYHRDDQNAAIIAAAPVRDGVRFGDILMREITTQDVKDLQLFLASQKKGDVKKNCSDPDAYLRKAKSVNALIYFVAQIFKAAAAEKPAVVVGNPCTGVKPMKPRETEMEAKDTIHRNLSHDETDKFFKAMNGTWYYNACSVLIETGMRSGELAALTIDDVDFNAGTIKINKTVSRSETGTNIISHHTKTDKSMREIPMTDHVANLIKDQLRLNRAVFGDGEIVDINPEKEKPTTYLEQKKEVLEKLIFKSSENTFLYSTILDRDIKRKCKKAGIDRFSAHAFRHTYATRQMMEEGINPNILKELLGHTSFKMTCDLYSHITIDMKKEAVKNKKFA